MSDAEPCLQLDVHVPSAVGGNWPVLVWVTGGSGPYSPGRVVREGIIVVVVHHRYDHNSDVYVYLEFRILNK